MKKRIFALLLVLVLALSLLPLSAAAADYQAVKASDLIVYSSEEYSEIVMIADLSVIDSKYGGYCLGTGVFKNGALEKAGYKPGTSSDQDVEKTFAAGIFSVSGEGDNQVFTASPETWTSLQGEGYTLSLDIHPTAIIDRFTVSCEGSYYPTESDYSGSETWKAAKTYHFSKEDPCCAGTWMIEATLSNGTTTLHAYTFQTVSFHYNITWDLSDPTTYNSVEKLNAEIAARTKAHAFEAKNYIIITLPAGSFTGYIDIPEELDTCAGLRLEGAMVHNPDNPDDASDMIRDTVIHGGVNTNIRQLTVQDLVFCGAGKNNETWPAGSNAELPNYGLVGPGQGVFRNCTFSDFYHAVHRYSNNGDIGVASFGGSDTEFVNNGVAIYIDVDQDTGGNDDLENCTFVGNGFAIQLRSIPTGLNLATAHIRQNKFIANGVDADNQTGFILWMPYNFFYHDGASDENAPVFNSATVNDCPAVVACPRYQDEPMEQLYYPDDSYLRNDSPEDALIPTGLINGQNFNMADYEGNIVATFSFTAEN